MFRATQVKFSVLALFLVAICTATVLSQGEKSAVDRRTEARKLFNQGNFRDAYDLYRPLCLEESNDGPEVAADLNMAVQSLQRLGRLKDVDELIESTVENHPENWRLLQAAAQQYLNNQHYGFMIAGEYQRGPHRGGGRVVNSTQRDRIRALQLMTQAMTHADKDDDKTQVANFYMNLSQQLLYNRGYYDAWRLQYLSNLDELPDYDEGYPQHRNYAGAPVDEKGNPVFYESADTWKDAENDGARWRWTLDQVVENNPARLNDVLMHRARFSQQQFGVNTMRQFGGGFRGGMIRDDGSKNDSGTYALHTLKDGETICRLASGIKRIELPEEFNHITLFRRVAETDGAQNQQALEQLCSIYENRRLYPQAAAHWKQNIEKHGPGRNSYRQKRLDQIVNNWGRFDQISTQPAKQGATVGYVFRNAKRVDFTAHKIKVDLLLDDVKTYLKTNPARPDWNRMNIQNLGYRLVHQKQAKYLGEEVAKWAQELDPRDNHFDRRITVSTPLQTAGAYLVTAKLADGNVSKIVLWVADTAIVRKQMSGRNFYFVGDAVDGKPVKGATLDFFGYRHVRDGARTRVVTKEFDATADDEGQVMPAAKDLDPNFTWLATAKTDKGRLAFIGFQGVWAGQHHDHQYNAVKVFALTDRPVYRPKQTVKYKFWVRHAQYDKEDVSQFAGRTFPYEIYNPKGEKVQTGTLETDEFGGCDGEWDIPADATLGQYRVLLKAKEGNRHLAHGNGNFRVEEYKKPEFEVSIEAPTEPVMLGEKIAATISAKYYFGSPVTNAKVKYKIMRHKHSQNWYPTGYWDWFYGPGYWWFAEDYAWYPGWHRWVGCVAPRPFWWGTPHSPPEMVAEQEVEIGEDGTVEVEIDTAIAKELHGDSDHKYSISAEVRDESRRTILGSGEVLVARKPFKIFSWVDRGYYRVGDTVKASFKAQTLDNKPVEGKGKLTLLKVTYNDKAQPIETPVRRWDINTTAQGTAEQQLRASAKGQYRLSYMVKDNKGHKIEGGYLFTIVGDGFDGRDYRFNDIELIPNKKTYKPGQKVEVQINTEQPNSTVLLFVRPSNGVYLPPKVIDIMGKSHVEEIEISKKDMPNFFVEAVTISGSKVHQQVREIIVPPEKRVVNVEVLPDGTQYLPGQKSKVKLKLTDFDGNPFVGTSAVTIYDKSLEYISGGSNVGSIRDFYWKWRRSHYPSQQHSLQRFEGNIVLPKQLAMNNLGIFGHSVASDLDAMIEVEKAGALGGGGQGGGFAVGRGGGHELLQSANGGIVADAGGNQAAFASAAPPAPGGAMNRRALATGNMEMAKAGYANNLGSDKQGGQAAAPTAVQPTIRTNFADSAFWRADIRTNKEGIAEFELDMPENLTAWKINVWSVGHGTKVGSGSAEVVTRKNLIVRLQAPRFFVQKDEVVLSANVHNYLDKEKEVTVSLEMPGEILEPLARDQLVQNVTIPAGGEQRVDWRVKVANEGTAVVRMKGVTDEESDAMEMKFPAYVHGMLKTESWAGTVRPDQASAELTINVPAERRPDETVLEVRYSPTLAAAMVDSLPYLLDYPYGCTEQTLNRFLPAVITQKVLLDMELDLAAIRDKRTNLNAQEIGDDAERAKQWKRFDRNPVFDKKEMDDIVAAGVKRLQNMQIGDGGWGWFSGRWERSYPHTTAVVVHGLQAAQKADVKLPDGMLDRGIAWLKKHQAGEVLKLKNAEAKIKPFKTKADNLDALCYLVLAEAGQQDKAMMEYLYRDRVDLAVYSKAMFGLALNMQGEEEKVAMILQNIDQFLVQDEENETAHLELPEGNYWWYWYGSEVEANAWYLKLLAATEPKGQRAPRLVKYLLNNRKHATYWNSTRDTAYCVEAMADYLRASDEMSPDMTVEVLINDKVAKTVEINRENLFSFDNKFVVEGAKIPDGEHRIGIRRKGKGPVYFNAYLTNFTLEDPIKHAGLEVKVRRKFYRLNSVEKTIKARASRGQAVDQRVEKYERELLENLDEVVSGDLIEVELEIESKNDYEYLIFEDMKAAGFEADDVRSGHYSAGGLSAYREMRDNRVSFFVRWLGRGKHSISYRLRAEIPGKFSALPAHAYAMYAPELKGNSDEMKLQVVDEE